jgi:hypothetical protein
MDASTIIYIVLGIGALILQGYMEKKKKEQARLKRDNPSEDEHSMDEVFPTFSSILNHMSEESQPEKSYEELLEEQHEENRDKEIFSLEYQDEIPKEKPVVYQMMDIPVFKGEAEDGIPEEGVSLFNYKQNEDSEVDDAKEEPIFAIDPRNLIIYSEIMAPKFRE